MRKLGLAVAVLSVLLGAFYIYTYSLRKQAESLVRNVYELSFSQSNPTLADLQRRFGRQLHLDGCYGKFGCIYVASVSNRPLAVLHIFHYAEMSSSFSVYDGIVGHNIVGHNLVDYMVTDGKKFNVTTHVQINYWNGDNSFDVDPWGNAAPANTNGLVMIGYASSPEDKRRVLSFDTRCMARMRGCNTVAELLPTVWQQTANHAIRCRIPNHDGTVNHPTTWED